MITLSLTREDIKGEILFRYNKEGWLIYYEMKANLKEDKIKIILKNIPRGYGDLADFLKLTKLNKTEIPEDLSFLVFWKKYNHKVGKKDRAERLWNTYSEADRAQILESIVSYDAFLARTAQNKAYPETYLSQKRHENEYK